MIIFSCFLLLITIVLIYLIIILKNKVEIYEDFIIERRDSYINLLNKIREIDNKQIFENDDEVGITFQEIKTEIEEFNKFIE